MRRAPPRRARPGWAAGRPLGPLDGVPVTIKDSLNVAGFATGWGSRLYAGQGADRDETPVAACARPER